MSENDSNSSAYRGECEAGSGKKKGGCLASFGCIMLTVSVICGVVILGVIAIVALFVGGIASAISESGVDFAAIAEGNVNPSHKYREEYVSGKSSSPNKIAVIDIAGVITSSSSDIYEVADSKVICEQIFRAEHDPAVRAIILNLNTPGGEVTASDDIYHKVVTSTKPVVAMMNSLAASGGYYIAAGCNSILANRLTLTGSIGVIIQTYKYGELFQKIGLKSEPFTSGPMKDMLDGARPTTPAEAAIVQTLVNNTYMEFVKIVSKGRNIPEETILKGPIGDGRVFDGQQALELNLVDRLGYFEDAVDEAARLGKITDSDYSVVRYTRSFSLASLFQASARTPGLTVKLPGSGAPAFELRKGQLYFLPGLFY